MSNIILSPDQRVWVGRLHSFQENSSDRKGFFLYYHWLEAKNRVFYLILSFAITLCICYIYSRELVFLYVKPFISLERSFIFTELTEALYVTLEICVITSLCLLFPLLCYQIWCFFIPSLYNRERRRWSLFLSISTLLSILALLSVYRLVLPEIASILLMFEIKSQILTIQLEARIDSYVNWSSKIFLAVLLYGQLPLLSYIAYHLRLLSPGLLIKNRKLLFALSLLVAAFLSPPDVIAQWLVTLSMWSWIEVIIFLGIIYNIKKEFVGFGINW